MGFLQNAVQNKVRENHMADIKTIVRKICKDGVVNTTEKEHLYQEGQKWYFSEEELDTMIQNQMALNRQDFLKEELPELIEEACHDTVVSVQERSVLYAKARVWKISEEEVNALIEQGISRRTESLARQQAAVDTAMNIASAVGNGIGSVFKGIGGFINKVQENRHEEKMAKVSSKTPETGMQSTPPNLPGAQSSKSYFIGVNGKQYGPYTIDKLKEMIPTKQFTEQTIVWTSGMPNWVAANQVEELALLFAPEMPPVMDMPPMPSSPEMPPMPK